MVFRLVSAAICSPLACCFLPLPGAAFFPLPFAVCFLTVALAICLLPLMPQSDCCTLPSTLCCLLSDCCNPPSAVCRLPAASFLLPSALYPLPSTAGDDPP